MAFLSSVLSLIRKYIQQHLQAPTCFQTLVNVLCHFYQKYSSVIFNEKSLLHFPSYYSPFSLLNKKAIIRKSITSGKI